MREDISGSARAALRSATAAVHERLHHVPLFTALARGTIDRAGYVSLLMSLFGFHAPMEAVIIRGLAMAPLSDAPSGWQRTAFLRQDLLTMGAGDAEIGQLPLLQPCPQPCSFPQAMGWLYVLEGSTVGGRSLARYLDHILPNNDLQGRRFLAAGADVHHISWTKFCAAIESCGADLDRRSIMVLAAVEAFDRFEAWFAESESLPGPRVPMARA